MWQLLNYDGKLAVTLGWYPDEETPTESRPVWLSNIEYVETYHGQFHSLKLLHDSAFQCWKPDSYTPLTFDTTDWKMFNETKPIKPPGRGGKDWQWEWSSWSRKWTKQYK